jgi:plasmid stability protein
MATLYVENVPADLYEALRTRAKAKRTSISTEVLTLLSENVVTPDEVRRRTELLERAARLRGMPPHSVGPFPSSEDLLREDRAR